MQETWVQSLDREDLPEKETEIHTVFLPGEFHGLGSLVVYGPWAHRLDHELATKQQLYT